MAVRFQMISCHQCFGGFHILLKRPLCCLQEFEDLDEITARYIQPMASFARDLLGHKYFQECHGGNKEVETDLRPLNSLFSSVLHRLSHITCYLVFSSLENGGVIGPDEEREANVYSVLYFSV